MIVRPVYHSMSWGLTGLRSTSNELRSEGNIQHSCAYSKGRGQERHAANTFRFRAGLSSEAVFREPVCILKKCLLRYENKDFPIGRGMGTLREKASWMDINDFFNR